MAYRKNVFQKKKPPNKVALKMKQKAAEKKLHDLGMELIREADIKEYYSNYQVFMNWEHQLDFKIEAFSRKREGRNDWATVRPPADPGKPYVLEVDITASADRKNDYKSLLFHEFTHIFDDLTIHERIKKAGVQKPGSWYTEAHATEVELMCSCGYDSIASINKVEISKIIPYCSGETTIAEYGKQKKKEIETRLAKAEHVAAIKHLQYYFGFICFVKRHCTVQEDVFSEILGTEFISREFGKGAVEIRDILLKPHISAADFKRMESLQFVVLSTIKRRQIENSNTSQESKS